MVLKPGASQADLAQEKAKAALELSDRLEGFVFEDQAYLISENLESPKRAEEVLLHEVVGHYGMESILGNRWNRFLDEVVALYGKKGLREIADLYGLDLETKEGRRNAAKEKIAQMAETGEKPGLLKRIYAAVRDALRRMGFTLRLNDADVQRLLERAERYIEGEEGILAEAAGERVPAFSSRPLSFKDREEIRKYLEGLKPEEIKALKKRSPAEYRAILKSIVRKIFPQGADIQFRREGRIIDYDHLLSDRRRQEYIHTLPATIKREDIKIEFRNGDVDKEVLIKKYFDPEIQKDIWDVVVLHNKEIRTKIARSGRKGEGYVEGLVDRAGNVASRSATPDEVKESASTHLGNTEINISNMPEESKTEEEDPDIAFSLSAPEVFRKLKARLQGEPRENLRIIFGENAERDLREFNDSFRISAWLGKTNKTVKALFDRQNRRDKDRSKLYHDFLSETKGVFDLDKDQMKEFSDLAFGLENKKVVDEPRFVKTGEREISKGTKGEIVTIPIYELNDKHYEELGRYLEGKKVSKAVRDAYVSARKTLDRSLTMIWDRLAEIKNIDPTLIEEFRTQIGSIENYFPHNRYGNFHIRAVDPNAKAGENTRYRMHFNALNEKHATWWVNRNIDRIREEAKKENPDLDWDSFKWEVDRNRQLPEEVYDFPIPVDAMQKIIESAADRMPEDMREGLKKTLSEEVANVLKSRGFGSHMIQRKDIPGFEKEDVARVLHDHFAGFSGWLTKMEAAHDFGEMLRGIDASGKPNEYKWGTRFVQDMLQNQTQIDRVVDGARTFFFLKYLGANVKTAAVNMTQNFVSGVPRLAMDTGVANAGKAFVKATADIRFALTEAGIKGAGEGRLTESEKRFLLDMYAEGWGQAQLTREMRGKVSGRFRQVKEKTIRVMGFPMEMAERYNRMSLGLAAFRAATEGRIKNDKTLHELKAKRGEKLSYEDAKHFAETVVNDAHFIYGKGNRPAFLRGTSAGKVLSSAYTFRSFSHNLLSMWRWMLTQGDKEGRKAFAYSMMSMIVLGGLGAVPIYGTLAALIRQLFGDDILESGVRKELPPGMRDLVMYGAPSIFGVNIGGSIGMEVPILDRANVNRSWSEQIGQSMGELLGIPYAVMKEMAQAVDAVKAGRPDRAAETVAPTVLRNIMSAVRLSTEGQTSISGKPINVPGERGPRKITEGEAIAKGLGFQPLSSTKAFDIYRTMEELKSYRDEKQAELANRYVAAQRKGDNKEMVRVRNEAREWNRNAVLKKRPEMRIDLQEAIKARLQARQPMKQMRGLAGELREVYGM